MNVLFAEIKSCLKHAKKTFNKHLKKEPSISWKPCFLQDCESDGPPAELNIMAQSTSIQRVQRLIDSVPLTNLLFTLLFTSYKKVHSLYIYIPVICIIAGNFTIANRKGIVLIKINIPRGSFCQLPSRGVPNSHSLCLFLETLVLHFVW